jgi:hypothetical protein
MEVELGTIRGKTLRGKFLLGGFDGAGGGKFSRYETLSVGLEVE